MPTVSSVPCVNVAGAVAVWVGTGSSAALEFLGYTVNGVEIEEMPFQSNVPSDLAGGTEGPPVDVQHMGDLHYIRLELGQFNDTILAKIRSRLNGVTEASSITPGTLIACSGYYYRVLLQGPNFTRNYLAGIPRGAIRMNAGTQFSRAMVEFECHRLRSANYVLWNTTTT